MEENLKFLVFNAIFPMKNEHENHQYLKDCNFMQESSITIFFFSVYFSVDGDNLAWVTVLLDEILILVAKGYYKK